MGTLKITQFFEQTTQPDRVGFPARSAGWTESWYLDATTAVARLAGIGLCQTRAILLPKNGNVVGFRIEPVDRTLGAGEHVTQVFPGSQNYPNDIPNMALLLTLKCQAASNVRHFLMRGISDDLVVGGELSADNNFKANLGGYLKILRQWQMRGEDLTQAKHPVDNITGAGLVTTVDNHGLNVGDTVNINRSHFVVGGAVFSGKFKVLATPTATTFSIGDVMSGAPTKGGTARKYVITYPLMAENTYDDSAIRITTRRVGRPFDLYVGRHRRR